MVGGPVNFAVISNVRADADGRIIDNLRRHKSYNDIRSITQHKERVANALNRCVSESFFKPYFAALNDSKLTRTYFTNTLWQL